MSRLIRTNFQSGTKIHGNLSYTMVKFLYHWYIPVIYIKEDEPMPEEKDSKIDEVATKLKSRINQGIYTSGQRLPSEREIAEELNISRVTVRGALSRLQAENIVDIIPRGGAIVRSSNAKVLIGPENPYIASGLELKHAGSFIRAMQAQGKQTLVRFIEPSSIIAVGNEIGNKLETTNDTQVLRRYRVHLIDKIPYRILDSYYLASLLGDLLGKDEGYIPLFKWMYEHTGQRAAKAYERLNMRMPSAEEAALLNISRTQPVVDMDRWVWSDKDTLFEYTHMIANAALHEFAYTYTIEEEASK
jgi:GntR family transcriptional regulator